MEQWTSESFKERFEQIKREFKLKNTDLARLAQVSDNAISKLLKGESQIPDVKTLVNLAEALNLDANWLLLGRGSMLSPKVSTTASSEQEKTINALVQHIEAGHNLIRRLLKNFVPDETEEIDETDETDELVESILSEEGRGRVPRGREEDVNLKHNLFKGTLGLKNKGANSTRPIQEHRVESE